VTAVRLVRIGDAVTIERHQVEARAIATGSLYVGLENIEPGGRFLNVRAVEQGELASSKFRFSSDHVLYGKLRPYLAKVARPYFSGVCSTDILPLRPRNDVDRSYLTWMLLNPTLVARANSLASGVNLPRISPQVLAELEIPLPSLAEQRRIANILDKADALRAKSRAALTELDALSQSIFLNMFGPSGDYRFQCSELTLEDVCSTISDGVHKTPSYESSGVPFVTVRNITSGSLDLVNTSKISEADHRTFTRRTRPEKGDVLVSKDGTIGIPCPVETDAEFSIFVSVALLKPRPDVLDQSLLIAQFQSELVQRQIRANSKGVAIRHLHLEDFRRLRLVIPPRELQREFGVRVSAVRDQVRKCSLALDGLDALFASIQHRAFRGEL
jgi:type I restriction enzyme S subunit